MPFKVLLDAKVFALAGRTGNRSGVYRYADKLITHLSASNVIQIEKICADLIDYPFYWQDLKRKRFEHQNKAVTWRDFLSAYSDNQLSTRRSSKSWRQYVPHILKYGKRHLPFQQPLGRWHLKQHISRSEKSILHSPFHLMPDVAKGINHLTLVRTVHDMLPLMMPQFFLPESVSRFQEALSNVGSGEHIICVSETVRSDIHRLMPRFRADQLHALPLAGDSLLSHPVDNADWDIFCRYFDISETEQFLLSVGTIEPRKNHHHLLKAFEVACKGIRDLQLRLIIVGALGWNYDQTLDMIATSEVADKIILLGSIPDPLLSCLYEKALATVFVSWGEGFGLPVLESMRHGIPVIASAVPALTEVAHEAAYFVDPSSVHEISEAIKSVCVSTELRDKLRTRGLDRAKLYSWNKTASATSRLYKKLIDA